jgi:hypothetical protein
MFSVCAVSRSSTLCSEVLFSVSESGKVNEKVVAVNRKVAALVNGDNYSLSSELKPFW